MMTIATEKRVDGVKVTMVAHQVRNSPTKSISMLLWPLRAILMR